MTQEDKFAQVMSAATTIRAYELLSGKELSKEQFQQYLDNYNGKYSKDIVSNGIGIIVLMRNARKQTLLDKIKNLLKLSSSDDAELKMMDLCARKTLNLPGVREEMLTRLKNNFRL
jgi:hypothetical protein